MMPSLASINQESFFNGINDMSFDSSFVSSSGASFAVWYKSACFSAPDLDPIIEMLIENISIEDGSSDLEYDHRPPRRRSTRLDELQSRWDNSPDHSKQGVQRWDTSPNSSFKKDSTTGTIILR